MLTHLNLRSLRPAGTRTRAIPKGYGFNLVSCPNYFFEMVSWVAFVGLTLDPACEYSVRRAKFLMVALPNRMTPSIAPWVFVSRQLLCSRLLQWRKCSCGRSRSTADTAKSLAATTLATGRPCSLSSLKPVRSSAASYQTPGRASCYPFW